MNDKLDELTVPSNHKNNKVIGSFVFRDDNNGCLTSLYFNTPSKGTSVESCKRDNNTSTKKFEGIYYTSWHEDAGEVEIGIVEISAVPNKYHNNDYILQWRKNDNTKTLIYYGEAFLYGELLVGAYWTVDTPDSTTDDK